jgi:hypothetical protein
VAYFGRSLTPLPIAVQELQAEIEAEIEIDVEAE